MQAQQEVSRIFTLCVSKAGTGRTCGISGTADTHEYHLDFIVKKCIEQRGFTEIIDDDPSVDPFPEHTLGYFIVQNKWTRALVKPTISRTISWDIGAFRRFDQSFCLRISLE